MGSRAHRTRRLETVQRAREINVVLLAPDLSIEHPEASAARRIDQLVDPRLEVRLDTVVVDEGAVDQKDQLAHTPFAVPCGGFSFCALFKLIWDDVGTREEHANIQSHPVVHNLWYGDIRNV